jgi:hypothetical protein
MVNYANDWRIPYTIKIDDGNKMRFIGIIPLRLSDIKRTVRLQLKCNKD